MADIYGSHFEYAGVESRTYGLILSSAGSERFDGLASDIEGITVYTKKYNRHYLVNTDYSTPLSFDIDIVIDGDTPLSQSDRRAVERWLFNRGGYRKLYIDMADDVNAETYELIDGEQKRLYLNCRFINPVRLLYNGGVAGYRATLEADSPYWWQDAVVKEFDFSGGLPTTETEITVEVDSDPDDYIYPKITVEMDSTAASGNNAINIRNATDANFEMTRIEGITQAAVIVIDSTTNYVTGQYYHKMAHKNFPRLVSGNNTIAIQGKIKKITFEYSNRRFF